MYQMVDPAFVEKQIMNQEHSIKPPAYNSYPYTELDDRIFEILLFLIYQREIRDKKHLGNFDDITLMQGVGEQGRDCVLHYKGKSAGLIQCKNYKTPINKPDAVREIIKFSLYYLLDNNLISDIDNFTYLLVAASGFNQRTSLFLSAFNTNIEHEEDLEKWINEVIEGYETFKNAKLTYEGIKDELVAVLKKIKVKRLTPEELNVMVDENPSIAKRFFSLHVVTSEDEIVKLREEVMKKNRMSYSDFLNHVNETVLNMEYIRSPEIKRKLVNRTDDILEQLYDIGEDKFTQFIKAIQVPFKNRFADRGMLTFEENLPLLTDIVIKVIVMSFVRPNLELSSEKGRAIKIASDEIVSLIFSEGNEEYDLVVLQLLKYFNNITDDLGEITTVIVGNSAPKTCILGGGGAQIDYEYIIDQIVDIGSENYKEEFTNLKNRFKFTYHCQNSFSFKTLSSVQELEEKLTENIRGNTVGHRKALLGD
ncbi:hypothetical protein [Sporosarcina sp. HYO08]|uniref:hypothetical protein n=1 Tax=Sporosarcina sp. HYO08 TaxID=1759557 RepID=UPI00079580C4|nr:hypothetical protein [Sporosarcina sp. HYO08]KXH86963.1 hypothetical protein AU377_13545 [Sporosarcina sp. HYO08]